MPIYVGFTQKRRTIRLLNAGETQYLLCPPADIEMAANLSDITNLRNVALFWEQIKGPTVPLASEDTIGTSFPFADTDDKTFRFYVDKDTNREQYKDVDIFYTPTSIMPARAQHTELLHQSMTVPNLAQQPGFITPPADGTFNTNVDIQPAQIISFDPVTEEAGLFKSIKFEILTDAGFVVDPEDIYASYDYAAGEFIYSIPLPNGIYRFRFYYRSGALGGQVFTSPLIVCNSTASPDDAYAIDSVHNIGHGQSHELVSIKHFTFLRQVVTASHEFSGFNAGLIGANGNIARPGEAPAITLNLTPTFKELLDSQSLYNIGVGYLETLTRLDPSNIGSN